MSKYSNIFMGEHGLQMKYENLILDYMTDIFDAKTESSSLTYEDFSSMSKYNFSVEDAIDFATSSKINKNYSDSNVLGIIEGIFFMPNGYSRNRRFYSEKLWTNCVSSKRILEILQSGMLGMFEHPSATNSETKEGLITALHPMNAGLVTKSLKITESNGKKLGIGKAYILNTPVGRILNALMKAKDENGNPLINLAVSSRAWARTKGKDDKKNDIMDEDHYILDAFDSVVTPGIAEAFPQYRAVEKEIITNLSELSVSESYMRDRIVSELGLKHLN